MSAPVIVKNEGDRWPWDVVDENPGAWVEITEERAFEAPEVLPPIYFRGGFAVSEPIRDDEEGRPTYLCVTNISGRHFCRELSIERAVTEAAALRLQVAP